MLKEKLKDDQKNALKAGAANRRMVIGMVLSAIHNKEIQKKSELSDDEVEAIVSSEVKKRKDAINEYEKGGRPELAEGEKAELEILAAYLPEQISEEEIRTEVKKTISDLGAAGPKDMGKVIGAVMAKLKSRADGQLVNSMVKEELSS